MYLWSIRHVSILKWALYEENQICRFVLRHPNQTGKAKAALQFLSRSFIVVNTVTNILAVVQKCSSERNVTRESQQINERFRCFLQIQNYFRMYLLIFSYIDNKRFSYIQYECSYKYLLAISVAFHQHRVPTYSVSLECLSSLQSLMDHGGKISHIKYLVLQLYIYIYIYIDLYMNVISHSQLPTFHSGFFTLNGDLPKSQPKNKQTIGSIYFSFLYISSICVLYIQLLFV